MQDVVELEENDIIKKTWIPLRDMSSGCKFRGQINAVGCCENISQTF